MALADALNHALANNTWKSYKTAANHVERIRKELGVTLVLPFSLEDTHLPGIPDISQEGVRGHNGEIHEWAKDGSFD